MIINQIAAYSSLSTLNLDDIMTIHCHILGFPRIGVDRELEFALEGHRRGEVWEAALEDKAAGLTWLPVHKVLSIGIVDGRNIWRTDLDHAIDVRQIALAIRDEVADLVTAGIGIIQIDEPAIHERRCAAASGTPTSTGPRARFASRPPP